MAARVVAFLRAAIAALAFASAPMALGADDRPGTVLVYNGASLLPAERGRNVVGYDAMAEATAWGFQVFTAGGAKSLFLEDDGRPMQLGAEQKIRNAAGEVVGEPIVRALPGGQPRVIGWTRTFSQQTRVAVIDLNAGTFDEAYQLVADGGQVGVIKHGVLQSTHGFEGGGLHLDHGSIYAGFKAGTNLPGARPYALSNERAGANIRLSLICCWSGKDPDGNDQRQRSVAQSLIEVAGVSTVVANKARSQLTIGATFAVTVPAPPEVTKERIERAITDKMSLPENAKKFGHATSIPEWLTFLPFQQQHALLRQEFGTIRVDGSNVRLDWKLAYRQVWDDGDVLELSKNAAGEISVTPIVGGQAALDAVSRDLTQTLALADGRLPAGSSPKIIYPANDAAAGEVTAAFTVSSILDSDAEHEMETITLVRFGHDGETTPGVDGLSLATGIFGIGTADGLSTGDFLLGTLELELVKDARFTDLGLYVLGGDAWSPLGGNVRQGLLSATAEMGALDRFDRVIVAGFGRLVREPSTPTLMLTAAVAALLLRWRTRTPASDRESPSARWRKEHRLRIVRQARARRLATDSRTPRGSACSARAATCGMRVARRVARCCVGVSGRSPARVLPRTRRATSS